MAKKVLFFFPHNPYPPRSGAHQRCLEMLSGLRSLGCRTTLASASLFSETRWDSASLQALESEWVDQAMVYETTAFDRYFRAALSRANKLLNRREPLDSALYSPPGFRRWMAQVCDHTEPDLIVINYAYWNKLLPRGIQAVTAMETHDLLTLNRRMRAMLQQRLPAPPIDHNQVDEALLREDFFDRFDLKADAEEFRIYDRYDYTIAISLKEAETIRANTSRTETLLIPMTQAVKNARPGYDGAAIFVTGPNPFNLQAYLYFVRRVLPMIRRHSQSFSLRVTGACCQSVTAEDGIRLSGFVPDLQAVYETAPFAICPVFGGTGQQVKVIEAMSYGVPVVALRAAAESSPIKHGVNGLVANDAQEFAEHCLRLWQDRELCRQLGRAAQETIAADYSRSRLLEGLSRLIQSKPASELSSANIAFDRR